MEIIDKFENDDSNMSTCYIRVKRCMSKNNVEKTSLKIEYIKILDFFYFI